MDFEERKCQNRGDLRPGQRASHGRISETESLDPTIHGKVPGRRVAAKRAGRSEWRRLGAEKGERERIGQLRLREKTSTPEMLSKGLVTDECEKNRARGDGQLEERKWWRRGTKRSPGITERGGTEGTNPEVSAGQNGGSGIRAHRYEKIT